MSLSSAGLPGPEGPGSVSGAPNLPAGFTAVFTSRYVDAGEVRLHAVAGGHGPPLLVQGWPQTWYAWRMLREDIFFGAEFDASAGTNKLPGEVVRYYIDTLAADPDHLRGSFGFYRAIPISIAQNEKRKERRDRAGPGDWRSGKRR
jgi:hypothetical protein